MHELRGRTRAREREYRFFSPVHKEGKQASELREMLKTRFFSYSLCQSTHFRIRGVNVHVYMCECMSVCVCTRLFLCDVNFHNRV